MYDPLSDTEFESNQPSPNSYWETHSQVHWPHTGQLPGTLMYWSLAPAIPD